MSEKRNVVTSVGERATRRIAGVSRSSTKFRRRYSKLRHRVPPGVVRRAQDFRSAATSARRLYLPVAHRSAFDNVFHACVHKTGSQWIISILTDPIVYRYSGLTYFHPRRSRSNLEHVRTSDREYPEPFPTRSIVSPLYMSFDAYLRIPKAGTSRGFFVQRDPRDLLVSWYHSARDNHVLEPRPDNPLVEARNVLRSSNLEDGLLYGIDYWEEQGRYEALRSWARSVPHAADVRLVRYEDLVGPSGRDEFMGLFEFLDIRMPATVFDELIDVYSFERLTGRRRGDADSTSHLRSGSAGGWRGVLSDRVLNRLDDVSGSLPAALGYD